MGEIADDHVRNFTSGRWGASLPRQRDYPRTTKAAIRDRRFSVVEVVGGRTNRLPGTKLVVCDNDEVSYWVWASTKVTGIAKEVCKVLEVGLEIERALQRRAFLSLSPGQQLRRLRHEAKAESSRTVLEFNDDI